MILDHAQTDWLGSKPVFYNEKTKKISYDIEEVIDYSNLEFHPEGLRNYLKFGYSVWEQTPIKHVKFLRYASEIRKNEDGELEIKRLSDPWETVQSKKTDSADVLEKIRNTVHNWENSFNGNIILPLSGGYDSRLLLCAIQDKARVQAYSYGYSKKQTDSFEVVRARKTAEHYGVNWECIHLGEFLKYMDEWNAIYGPSVHAHGMYQMEFYKTIMAKNSVEARVLSGIIGDAWAGSVHLDEFRTAQDLTKLGYSHGLCIEEDVCVLEEDNSIRYKFWEENRDKLQDSNWRVVYSMRTKIMLLRYLMKTPEEYGLNPWSPFLDMDIASDMLCLPEEEKQNRMWQKRYFEKEQIEYGWLKKECDYNMIINENALRMTRLKPLDVTLLSSIIRKDYLEWVNQKLSGKPIQSFSAKPKTIPNIANKFIKKWNADKVKALTAYELLYPLQQVLEKANHEK